MQSESYHWPSSTPGTLLSSLLFLLRRPTSYLLGTWHIAVHPPPDYKSSAHSPLPSNLKRQRSDLSIATSTTVSSGTKMSPSIPGLNGDIILDVFTHRSLRFAGAPPGGTSGYGDSVRLAVLGEKALECAVTDTLFKKQPLLDPDQIKVRFLLRPHEQLS